MTLEEVCEYYKSINAAAIAVGVSRQSAYNWGKLGYIPYDKQKRFEHLTKGVLKARKNSKAEKLNPDTVFFPIYRYYSDTLGMCPVKSLVFKPNSHCRITYYNDDKEKTFTSFNSDNLMQASKIKDKNGVYLFEKDIINHVSDIITFSSLYDISAYNHDNDLNYDEDNIDFEIIGNTFEGVKNG